MTEATRGARADPAAAASHGMAATDAARPSDPVRRARLSLSLSHNFPLPNQDHGGAADEPDAGKVYDVAAPLIQRGDEPLLPSTGRWHGGAAQASPTHTDPWRWRRHGSPCPHSDPRRCAHEVMFSFEGGKFQGPAAIAGKLGSLPFQACEHNIVTVDCQPSGPLGGTKLLGPDRRSNRRGRRFNGSLVQPFRTG